MQLRSKMRGNRSTTAIAAAIAGIGFASIAHATTYTAGAFEAAQIEPGSAYQDSGGAYFQLRGATNQYANFGILDFNGGSLGIPAGQQVTGVNSDLTLTMSVDNYNEPPANQSYTFYLATDTSAAEVANGATLMSWEPNSTYAGGLNAPGQTGSFAAGTQLTQIGTGTYVTGQADATPIPFNLTLNSTQESYIQGQINTGNTVRIVMTTNESDANYTSFYGYANSVTASIPQLSFDLTTGVGSSNTSKLYINTAGTKTASVNVGTYLTDHGSPQYCVLQGGSATTTVTLGNSSSTAGDNLTYIVQTQNTINASASVTSPGPDPIAPGSTSQATVGFGAADTSLEAGNALTGTAVFANASNYATDATPVTVSINPALVLQERHVDSLGGSTNSPASAPNAGKVLVGKTGTVITSITTDNPVNLTDFSNDALTTLTLNANMTATPFVVDDFFTKAPVATLGATSGSTPQTFDSTESENVTGMVTVAVSGVYGNDTPVTEGTVTQNYTPNFTAFPQAAITGDGLQGEKDSMDVYLQWQGYQVAAVTASTGAPGSPLIPGTAGNLATLSNAASNDNTYLDTSSVLHNNGLRATAWVTGTGFNQTWGLGGWSQTGFNASNDGTGTVITAGGPSVSGTINFAISNQMINGVYGATMSVALENEQDIQGASANDLTPVTFSLQTTVSGAAGNGTGTYTLNGGTLVAGATNLTGSFTQSGGQSTFTNITGTGQFAISGGSATLAVGGGASSVSSLSITGTGSLDITNNHMFVSYTAGTKAAVDANIRSYIIAGRNGGGWNGATGIKSSSAALPANSHYAIGYADGADGVVAGLSSGQIEIKYTLLGDADLDGVVTGSDFTALVGNLGKSGRVWDQGDFEYTGSVTGSDFTDLVSNLGKSATGADVVIPASDYAAIDAFAAANGLTADVPEPASMGILALSGLAILSRRTRRRAKRC